MNSEKFLEAMRLIYMSFYHDYVINNPGCNSNDIERAFLNANQSLLSHPHEGAQVIIESIR